MSLSFASEWLGDAVLDCAVTLTITRRLPGSYNDDGRFVRGGTTTLDIQATVQPLNGRELQLLFQNTNAGETIKLYTKSELNVGDPPSGIQPDRFDYLGRTYEVQNVFDWENLGDYYKYIAVKATA